MLDYGRRMETLQIARLWAAAAWADGKVHPAEAAALRRFIEASEDLDGAGKQAAHDLLVSNPRVDLGELERLSKDAKEGVYRAALGIVRLDGSVTPDEVEWLKALRARLALDEALLQRIEREAR